MRNGWHAAVRSDRRLPCRCNKRASVVFHVVESSSWTTSAVRFLAWIASATCQCLKSDWTCGAGWRAPDFDYVVLSAEVLKSI